MYMWKLSDLNWTGLAARCPALEGMEYATGKIADEASGKNGVRCSSLDECQVMPRLPLGGIFERRTIVHADERFQRQ